jgi:hypothetical protein
VHRSTTYAKDVDRQRELRPCCQTIRGAGFIVIEQSLVRKNPKQEGSMQTIGNRVKHEGAGFLAVIACSATLMLSLQPTASASPWPQQKGDGLLISSVSYLQENNSLANANPAVGNGTFSRLDLGFYSEYGLTDTLTLGAATRLERVRLRGSSVSGETSGITDVELFVRPVLWRGHNSILAAQGMIIVPAGYSLDRNPALGDGAVGVEPRVLFGQGFDIGSRSSFFDVQAAYRVRFGGPADQVRVDATLGSHLTAKCMLLLQSRNTISMRNQSNDNILGSGFGGAHETDYDLYTLTLSVVREVAPHWSLEFGGISEVAARNYNNGNGVFSSVWRKF